MDVPLVIVAFLLCVAVVYLDKTRDDLVKTLNVLDKTRNVLDKTRDDLVKTRDDLVKTLNDLDKTRNVLDKTRNVLDKTRGKMNDDTEWFVSRLATTNTALDVVNAELAALKVQYDTAAHEHKCQLIGQANRLKYQFGQSH